MVAMLTVVAQSRRPPQAIRIAWPVGSLAANRLDLREVGSTTPALLEPECVREFEDWDVAYTSHSDTEPHDQHYGRSNVWCN